MIDPIPGQYSGSGARTPLRRDAGVAEPVSTPKGAEALVDAKSRVVTGYSLGPAW